MTPPTQDDLAAGRELDARVARDVMGLTGTKRVLLVESPEYSTDLAAAWQIVEHMDSLGWKVQVRSDSQLEGYEANGPWVCVFASRDGAPWAAADTAPLAVCKAALKAVSG